MKLLVVSAFVASLVAAVPALANEPVFDAIEDMMKLTAIQVDKFEVNGLGGMTLRAEQVYNPNFITKGRGQRAYVQAMKKYANIGAALPPELLCSIVEIFQALGITGALSPQDIASCANAGGNGTPPGTGPGTGTGTGTGTGGGARGGTGTGGGNGTVGGGNSNGNGTTRGNGTTKGSYLQFSYSTPWLLLTVTQVRFPLIHSQTTWNISPLYRSARHRRQSCSTSTPVLQISGYSVPTRLQRRGRATRRMILLAARHLQRCRTPRGVSDMAMAAVLLESSTRIR